MRFIGLILVFLCSSCMAQLPEYTLQPQPLAPSLIHKANTSTTFKLPLSVLENAYVVGGNGLTFILPGKKGITIASFSGKDMGYPGFDMRLWPLYVLGEKSVSGLPKAQADELQGIGRIILSGDDGIYKKARMKWGTKTAYLVLGKAKSTIMVVDADNADQMVQVSIDRLTENEIQTILLQGVMQ